MATLTVSGGAGVDAQLQLDVEPQAGTTVIRGQGPTASLFDPSKGAQTIGHVPQADTFHVLFHRRPWSLDAVATATGNANLHVDSVAEGLPNVVITTPDIFTFSVTYTVPGGP